MARAALPGYIRPSWPLFHVKHYPREVDTLSDPGSTGPTPRFRDYEDTNYRKAFWEGHGREYEDLAERIALRRLLPPTGDRIIDIGGGFGRLVDLYAGYREIVLMDYSRFQLQDALARLGDPRIIYVAANLYQMPFAPGAFDAAVMVRVLHHLSDVAAAFHAIDHILRPHAAFLLEYANKRHLKAILRYFAHRQKHNPFTLAPWEFAELNFDFHPAYIEQHLAAAGFRIERQLSLSHFRIAFLKRLLPARALTFVDACLQGPTAPLKLTPSMLVRSCATGRPTPHDQQSIFCCPHCGGALTNEPVALRCTVCGRRWNTLDGIYDFKDPIP